jgi:hypothetical protein
LQVEVVRALNFYKEGDLTPYREKLVDLTLPDCWAGVQQAGRRRPVAASGMPLVFTN